MIFNKKEVTGEEPVQLYWSCVSSGGGPSGHFGASYNIYSKPHKLIHTFSGGGVMGYIDGIPSSKWAAQKVAAFAQKLADEKGVPVLYAKEEWPYEKGYKPITIEAKPA
jgi:hypothetical protein